MVFALNAFCFELSIASITLNLLYHGTHHTRQCDEQLRIISVSVRGYGAVMAFSIQLRGGAVIARRTDKIRDYGYDGHDNRG